MRSIDPVICYRKSFQLSPVCLARRPALPGGSPPVGRGLTGGKSMFLPVGHPDSTDTRLSFLKRSGAHPGYNVIPNSLQFTICCFTIASWPRMAVSAAVAPTVALIGAGLPSVTAA